MDDPVKDIRRVITTLCQGTPSEQQQTLEQYFTPNASFTHPFCRTGSFNGSRDVIARIYQWYKILSPRIELIIDSVAYDETNLFLYVTLRQVFSIQFFPFHHAHAKLTTVLTLTRDSSEHQHPPPTNEHALKFPPNQIDRSKLYIAAQNDLYQTNEFVKFVVPWFGIGDLLVTAWQFFATAICVLLAILFWPMTWLEENSWGRNRTLWQAVTEGGRARPQNGRRHHDQ